MNVTPTQALEALEALDSLDDYARMSVGVDAAGPRETLLRFINERLAERNRVISVLSSSLEELEHHHIRTDKHLLEKLESLLKELRS